MSMQWLEACPATKPSDRLISAGTTIDHGYRINLLDKCAEIMGSNGINRSDQCLLFAMLVQYGLMLAGIESLVVIGRAQYMGDDSKSFSWDHAWVVVGDDIIDGNLDAMIKNPKVPKSVHPAPYWGPLSKIPLGRKLKAYGNVADYKELAESVWREVEEIKDSFQS